MKTKFTPGPWKYNAYSNIVESDGEAIALFNDNFSTDIQANAALIAAAPEMFEALENALRLIVVAENNNAFKDCALPLIGQRSIEQIESILKKARGE